LIIRQYIHLLTLGFSLLEVAACTSGLRTVKQGNTECLIKYKSKSGWEAKEITKGLLLLITLFQ